MSKKTLYKKIALYSVFLIVACIVLFALAWREKFDGYNTFVDNAVIENYKFERLELKHSRNVFFVIETTEGKRYYVPRGMFEFEDDEIEEYLKEAIEDKRIMRMQAAEGTLFSKPFFGALELVDLSDEYRTYLSIDRKNEYAGEVQIVVLCLMGIGIAVYSILVGITVSDYRLSQNKKEKPEKYLYGKELEEYRARQRQKRKQSMQKKSRKRNKRK